MRDQGGLWKLRQTFDAHWKAAFVPNPGKAPETPWFGAVLPYKYGQRGGENSEKKVLSNPGP
jgi:hypothetical protein